MKRWQAGWRTIMSITSSPLYRPSCPRKLFVPVSWSSAWNSKEWRCGPPQQVVDLRAHRPPGEGAGALEHVLLRVVARAHREELQQLPAPILVGRTLVVLVLVQPVEHRRVVGQVDQQVPVVAHPVIAEDLHLLQHLVRVLDLRVAGGEHVVPEEGHLLLERPLRGHHAPEPVELPGRQAQAALCPGVVAVEQIQVRVGLPLRVQQHLHQVLVAMLRQRLHLGRRRAEPGPAHQVGRQGYVLASRHPHTSSRPDYTRPQGGPNGLPQAQWDSTTPSFPRRRESRAAGPGMGSRLHGNDDGPFRTGRSPSPAPAALW